MITYNAGDEYGVDFVHLICEFYISDRFIFLAQTTSKPMLYHNSLLHLKDVGHRVQISLLHSKMQPNKLRGKEDTTTMLSFPTNDSTVNVLAISSDYS